MKPGAAQLLVYFLLTPLVRPLDGSARTSLGDGLRRGTSAVSVIPYARLLLGQSVGEGCRSAAGQL